jgi:hypothetical protein
MLGSLISSLTTYAGGVLGGLGGFLSGLPTLPL